MHWVLIAWIVFFGAAFYGTLALHTWTRARPVFPLSLFLLALFLPPLFPLLVLYVFVLVPPPAVVVVETRAPPPRVVRASSSWRVA